MKYQHCGFVAFQYYIRLKREDVYPYILGLNGYSGIHASETILTNMDTITILGGPRISYHIIYKLRDEITYPSPNKSLGMAE